MWLARLVGCSSSTLLCSHKNNPKTSHRTKIRKVLHHSAEKQDKDIWLKCVAAVYQSQVVRSSACTLGFTHSNIRKKINISEEHHPQYWYRCSKIFLEELPFIYFYFLSILEHKRTMQWNSNKKAEFTKFTLASWLNLI